MPVALRRLLSTVRSHPGWWILGLVVLAATVARIVMCAAGPDLDSDSYGHAIAGRRMLLRPTHLAHHWVWLPLLHAINALMAALGAGLQGVRYLNVAVSATVPVALAQLLHRHLRDREIEDLDVVPWLAGALVALDPVTLHLGSTGQTEPLFQALVVGTCLFWGFRKNVAAAVVLALACLTRYEAWLLLPVFGVLWWFDRPRTRQRLLPIVVPGAVVALWCVLQYLSTGEWLHFLRLNSEFVKQYFVDIGDIWGNDYLGMATRYAYFVPGQVMYGLPYALALLGVWWMAKRCQPALLWTSAVLLAFVTYGLLFKKHLGLDRHAVALVPAYAVAMAGGASVLVTLVWRSRASRWLSPRWVAVGLAAVVVLWVGTFRSWPRLIWQVEQQQISYSSANAAATALQSIPDAGLIYCDVAEVEVLSNLPPKRFATGGVKRVTPDQIRGDVARLGTVVAASKPERLQHLTSLGRPLFQDQWFVVLRFNATTVGGK